MVVEVIAVDGRKHNTSFHVGDVAAARRGHLYSINFPGGVSFHDVYTFRLLGTVSMFDISPGGNWIYGE
jgi:hypothetical protein